MQAIILAAGKGTRMGELVLDTPKPMLLIDGKNLIEWKIDNLPEEIDEIILVVHYLQEKIREYFGSNFNGRKITYVEVEPLGSGYGVWQCAPLIKDRCVVLMGDDLYTKEAIANAITYPFSVTVQHFDVERPGVITHDENYNFTGINDGIRKAGFINTGLYTLTKDAFAFDLVQVPDSSNSKGEFGLPHTLVEIAKTIPVKVIQTNSWYQVTAPEDLNPSEEVLMNFR